mgnify:FL=1
MDKYIKSFVNKLYELYGYRVTELKGNFGPVYPWCSVKVTGDYAVAVLFTALGEGVINTEAVLEAIKAETGSSEAAAAVVYIMEENRESLLESFRTMGYPGIVVDKGSGTLVYANGIGEDTLNDVYRCLMVLGKSEEKEKVKAPVTYTIIGINIAAYIITAFLSNNIASSNTNVLVFLGAKVNSLIAQGEYYRLVTCMFLHGGIVHLGFNMYALYSIGPLVENVFGRKKFILIYFISGILSSLMSYTFSSGISIGASGAIFGLLGA